MITFVQLGELGRLGNQLFQYAALKSVALENNYEVKIPHPSIRTWHGQKCLLGNFNIEAGILTQEDLKGIKNFYSEPSPWDFDSNIYNIPDNTNISGFFQSTFYFEKHLEQVKQELTPQKLFLEKSQDKINKIKSKYKGYEIVSLHLRRGDNTDNSNESNELNNMYGNSDKLDPNSFYGKYLNNSKNVFRDKKVKFLIFSGGSRSSGNNNISDLEWCKQNLIGEEYIFPNSSDTMSDFCLIMSCDYNIISHVSSFGWWAAFLNKNQKEIVAPKNYHPDMKDFTYRKGFYPKGWTLV
jgi:hypothetical protein